MAKKASAGRPAGCMGTYGILKRRDWTLHGAGRKGRACERNLFYAKALMSKGDGKGKRGYPREENFSIAAGYTYIHTEMHCFLVLLGR